MRQIQLLFLLFVAFIPFQVFAECASSGYTVIFVNGILTSEQEAKQETKAFKDALGNSFNSESLIVQNGYNPPHITGLGDKIESIAQTFNTSVSDYDLNTILLQIHPEITTRKILLVGHSQGTFYTNEMYDYLVQNGVPKESIGVYNLATPASFVAGGGNYLTSANDKLIYGVRQWDAAAGASEPLPANILIPVQPGDDADIYGGHHFQADYLAGAAGRIVSDINDALGKLKASGAPASDVGCFVPPPETIAYKAQKVAFNVADPLATNTESTVAATGQTVAAAAHSTYGGVALVLKNIGTALSNFFPATPASVGAALGAAAAATLQTPPQALPPAPPPKITQPTNVPTPSTAQSEPTQTVVSAPPPPTTPPPNSVPPPPPPIYQLTSVTPGFGGGGPSANADSGSAPAAPAPSLEAPAFSFTECSHSLSSSICLVATTTVTLTWGDVAAASYYSIRESTGSADLASTTATTTQFVLADEIEASLVVIAHDSNGNTATSSPQTIAVMTHPLLINEVAWAGTVSDPTDEWIELKSRSPYTLDLSHMTLAAADGAPSIVLSGAVAGGGYYLIERREEATNVVGDLLDAFDQLSDGGEELLLTWFDGGQTIVLDRTPTVATCGNWCAGFVGYSFAPPPLVAKMTMERTASGTDGTLAGSWQNGTSTSAEAAQDASGNTILGTPRAANSEGAPLPPPPPPLFFVS